MKRGILPQVDHKGPLLTTGLKGKVAVVTGGASGIGKAAALAFAREGAKVAIVTARSAAEAERVVAEIEARGGEARFVRCDVTQETQVEEMVGKVVEAFGSLDFAFNNAGVGPDGLTIPFASLTDVEETDWDVVMDTNLKGVFFCMKHELRQMRKQRSGVIVNTSSTAGSQVKPGFGAYCPAKAGINCLSKMAAAENKDLGIRVNVVAPGPIKGTGMSDRLLAGMSDSGAADGLRAAMGVPDDVARVVIWLCSEQASHVSGNVLSVDGGLDIA